MNFHQITPEVFRFELYNLCYFQESPKVEISGHYRFWFHRGNRAYCFTRHGNYRNLVSMQACKESVAFPTAAEHQALGELMSRSLRGACFYDRERACNRGAYLLPELEAACLKGDRHRSDASSLVFDVDYPDADYKADPEYWDQLRQQDQQAVVMLGGIAPDHQFCHPLELVR